MTAANTKVTKRTFDEIEQESNSNNEDEPPFKKAKTECVDEYKYNIALNIPQKDLLTRCECHHRWNLDKLQRYKLCVTCHQFVTERKIYLNVFETHPIAKCLQPLKFILLQYLMHKQTEYYTNIHRIYPKKQEMLDDWYRYTSQHNTLQHSIKLLKFQMKTSTLDEFLQLLCTLQPWMTINHLKDILKFQLHSPDLISSERACVDADFAVGCNGCNAAGLTNNNQTCWICHMAVKTILMIYFTVDFYKDRSFFNIVSAYLHSHHVHACEWYWNLSEDYRSQHLFGNHVVPDHIVYEIEEYIGKPPVITRIVLKRVYTKYISIIRSSHSNYYSRRVNGVSFVDEKANLVFTCNDIFSTGMQ